MITTIITNNKKIERDLAHLLKALASWDIHIQNYRIAQTEHHHFNILLAFQQIDKLKRGYITKKKFHDFLVEGQVNCSFKEWEHIHNFFFKEQDIQFQEFMNFLLPQTINNKNILNDQEPTNQLMEEWNREFLLRFFERIITSIRELNQLKFELQQWVYYDIHNIWKVLSIKYPTKKIGFLSQDSIKDLIEQYGFHFSLEEFQALLRIVKCKIKQDYLTQQQLYNLISPPAFLVSNSYLQQDINKEVQKKEQTYDHQQYRKAFDLVREDRPRSLFDSNYMDKLREHYKQHKQENQDYEQNLRNQSLQYNKYFSSNFSQIQESLHKVDTVFNQYGGKIRYYYQ